MSDNLKKQIEEKICGLTDAEKLDFLKIAESIILRRSIQKESHNCLFCDKALESALPDDVGNSFQPYAGGEVFFEFCFGSTKFDNYIGGTTFSGYICDDCAEKYVPKMKDIRS